MGIRVNAATAAIVGGQLERKFVTKTNFVTTTGNRNAGFNYAQTLDVIRAMPAAAALRTVYLFHGGKVSRS